MREIEATLEWHFYCPNCDRGCLSRFIGGSLEPWRAICPDCQNRYTVKPVLEDRFKAHEEEI